MFAFHRVFCHTTKSTVSNSYSESRRKDQWSLTKTIWFSFGSMCNFRTADYLHGYKRDPQVSRDLWGLISWLSVWGQTHFTIYVLALLTHIQSCHAFPLWVLMQCNTVTIHLLRTSWAQMAKNRPWLPWQRSHRSEYHQSQCLSTVNNGLPSKEIPRS